MKRFVALLLACCVMVSALSISVFASGSILGVEWDSSCYSKTITVPSGSSKIYFSFAPVRRLNGFGSISLSLGTGMPGRTSYDSKNVYSLPSGSTIKFSLTMSISGLSGFGSEKIPGSFNFAVPSTDGDWSVIGNSGSSSLSSYLRVESGKLIYTTNFTITTASDFYSYANIRGSFTSSNFSGKDLTVNVEKCSVRVTSLGESTTTEPTTDQVINNINNTIINNNTEVIAQITGIVGILDSLFENTVTINAYLDSLVGSINAMGDDLDSVLAYLSNTLNQLNHISTVIDDISDKFDISNGWFEQIAGHLVKIQPDVGLCSTYLQGIYNTISKMIGPDVQDILDLLTTSETDLAAIVATLSEIRDLLGSQIVDQLSNIFTTLVRSGQDIGAIKTTITSIASSLRDISADTKSMVKSLEDLNSELQKIGEGQQETNDRLKAIQELLEDFEIKDSKSTNNVLSSNDQKGLGAIVSKLITHLLSVVDFVSDLFGSVFTSVPSTISAYNSCNSFWGDQKTYVYTPHQISGYTEQGGSTYENSNESVQALFAEAEKYLGYPYVFGGSSPETSFDCSGYVSYVLNHSVFSDFPIGRKTAQGLYDLSEHISRIDAKPGDLVFFTGTYDCADTVSHVGIYAGDGKMLHCGNPIQYESIDTTYWQSHFYAFGRLYYNY